MLRQVLLHGVFHADPHPGNVLLLADGRLGLLDFGSVGRLDAALRGGLRDLLAAVDRGDPGGLRDGLLEIVDRPDEIDEQRLERALGALIAKHVSHGQAPDLDMFTDLFRVVAEFRLSIPPAIAAVFRALATVEGTLALLSPGFNIPGRVAAFANRLFGERLHPDSLRRTAAELTLNQLFGYNLLGGQCSAGAATAVCGVPVTAQECREGRRRMTVPTGMHEVRDGGVRTVTERG